MSSSKSTADSSSSKPLGEILLEAGLVSIYQIEVALQEQKQYHFRIGEILASHGWIKQETADFFAEQWTNLIQKKTKRPLAFYLYAAALIDKKQLAIIKAKQKQSNFEDRLHSIAVDLEYVKQETVDFFLKYLFGISNSKSSSFTKPYEIIKNYINGESDFRGLELSQTPLSSINLINVILDNSNFKQANLNNCNFSYSSLIKANLALADLKLANLSHAHVSFQQACLVEADLRKSNLEQANFCFTNLQESDLRDSNLFKASFAAADLRGAKLASSYSYTVYYDKDTAFDVNFNPISAGWKLKRSRAGQ